MQSDQPIIVVKKTVAAHGHHGGAWKVAYADFVTAMMAFFLVMWILGLNQESRKAISAYFNDPTGMMKQTAGGMNVIQINKDVSPKKKSGSGKDRLLKFKKDREGLQNAKMEIQKKIEESPKFQKFKNNIEITLTRDGLRIELLEDKEPLFFESGSANLRSGTVDLLRYIGPILDKLPNNIIMEGHTDARPYSGRSGYNNRRLSTDRAQAACDALEPTLTHGQMKEVRGLGASRLRNTADPFHYSNRRISVLVSAMNYIEGVPLHQADEKGLLGLKPEGPNLDGELVSRAQEAAQGKGGAQ